MKFAVKRLRAAGKRGIETFRRMNKGFLSGGFMILLVSSIRGFRF